jgi:hypothetical protein
MATRTRRTFRRTMTETVREIRALAAVHDRKLGDRLLRETVRMLRTGAIEVRR